MCATGVRRMQWCDEMPQRPHVCSRCNGAADLKGQGWIQKNIRLVIQNIYIYIYKEYKKHIYIEREREIEIEIEVEMGGS